MMKKFSYYMVLFFIFVFQSLSWAQNDTILVENNTIQNIQDSTKHRLVGAIDVIFGDDLMHSNEYRATNALAGLASGLYASKASYANGVNWSTLKVRGLSRGNMEDGPLVVVDGIPNRSIEDLSVESIESISVLKDVTAKMLYGSQAANGVLLVKTRRGKVAPRKLSFSVESGIRKASVLPNYLDAGSYATKYNEARSNDGLSPLYSDEAISNYKNGTSPLLYPNMDYYGTFLKDYANLHRINSTLTGGGEKTQYFLNLEYVRETGLEAVGKTSEFNQLNLVSNLDYKVNEIISMHLDISSKIGMHSRSRWAQDNLFSGMSTHRPNDYPFFVTPDQSVDTDQLTYNTVGEYNLYGRLTRSGYLKVQDFKSQTTLGINFNLNDYIEGLTANTTLGFDSYNNIYYGKTLNYATYRIIDENTTVRIGEDEIKSNESKFLDDFNRNIAGSGSLNYDRTFGLHAIRSSLVYSMRQLAYKSTEDAGQVKQDIKGVNTNLSVNYAYDSKYVLELNGSYLGSDRFAKGNRFKPFGAAGTAWVISNESFMDDVDAVDYLKLKGSYGVMGYDHNFDYYIYRDAFSGGGAFFFGINNDGKIDYSTRVSKIGNPDVTFEEAHELNVGLEAELLGSVSFEINYFNNLRKGMPAYLRSALPGYVSGVAPIGNYNEVRNKGVDASLQYSKQLGDLYLSFGGNLIFSEAVYEAYDELNFYKHLDRTGKVTDVLFGYVADGLFGSQQDIDSYGVGSSLGAVTAGDIKYVDFTNDLGDNVIDEFDQTEIGHFFPRINYGVNLNLVFKGFELYVLGQGVANKDIIKNSTYFFNYGERKYSEVVLEEGYPRLTSATSGGHSFQNSTYWLENGAYFKLRVAELSYDLPQSVSKSIKAQKIKLFARGTDLFTISGMKVLDPEDLNAGVTKYPLYKTGSFGAKIIF